VEVQEPTCILQPGVLVGLNSLLERCNSAPAYSAAPGAGRGS